MKKPILLLLLVFPSVLYSYDQVAREMVNGAKLGHESFCRDGNLYTIDSETNSYTVPLEPTRFQGGSMDVAAEIAVSFMIGAFETIQIGPDFIQALSPEVELEFSGGYNFLHVLSMFLQFNKVTVDRAREYGQFMKAMLLLQKSMS